MVQDNKASLSMSGEGYSDDATIQGRIKRYAKVGGAVGGLGLKLAGARYLGMELDRDQHAEELKLAIGGIKGPLMKVAQILATIPDALPESYAKELQQLQANAPSMGWPFVKRRMAAELGGSWPKLFQSFEQRATHAASLGQVHRAVLPDNRPAACKLQYPDMQSAVDADLRQLQLVFNLFEMRDRSISTGQIHTELSARLREELDYAREARHTALYTHMLADEPQVHVPQVVDDLSTDRLLTMVWLSGAPFLSVKDRPLEERNQVALNMFRAWYVPFYYYGVIHGDPHFGNYTIRDDLSINLLDYGCVRVFPPSFVTGVIDLYNALRHDDEALEVHAYETWGFKNLSKELRETLNIWARFVYAPLMDDSTRPIQESKSGLYGAKVASKVHAELRKHGGVEPPREFVLMDRAAVGLGSVFLHLGAEINWYALFHDLIADFDADALAARQAAALERAAVPLAA